MAIQILDPVLAPEPLPVGCNVERRAEHTAIHRLFQIGRVGFGTCKEAGICEAWVKACLFQTFADDCILGDIFFLGPAGAQEGMAQLSHIARTVLCRGDDRIRGRGGICGPMRRLQVELHSQICRLAQQFLCAIFDARNMPVLGWSATRAAEQRHDIQRLVVDGCAMFCRNLFQPGSGEVGIGRQCRKIVVNLSHLHFLRCVIFAGR